MAKIRGKGIPLKTAGAGDKLEFRDPDVTIDVLHPDGLSGSVNANSLVLKLWYKDFGTVFFSDVEISQQEVILEKYPELSEAKVITAAHHGRDISDTFIEQFREKIFIVSTGPFDALPMDEGRLKQLQGEIYRTDKGDIILTTDGKNVRVKYGEN